MEFKVLTTSGADGDCWRGLVNRLDPAMRDLHFLPGYARIYEKCHGFEGRLACYGDGDSYVIQPFMVRTLNSLPFLAAQGAQEPFRDIASPYGYGGPLARAPSPAAAMRLFEKFDRHFTAYCRNRKFASEFCCLHPLLENHELAVHSPTIEIRFEKPIVSIDLTQDEAELRRQLSRGHKSGINRARRGGVRIVQVPPDASNLALLARLYFATMDRHDAAQKWYFPSAHFSDCVAELGQAQVALFFAEAGAEVAAACLILHDSNVAYFHYGGSDERHLPLRPVNYLMHEITLWAKRAGKLCYHLGGGVTGAPEDGLLQFKSGFSPERKPLYVYGRVHDEAAYQTLCDYKREHESAVGARMTVRDYFPLYRR